MKNLVVWRIGADAATVVGMISARPLQFAYAEEYLKDEGAAAISLSLPLRVEPYTEAELFPYFDGLLPENETRTEIAKALNARPDDFLAILLRCGEEIIGDVAITDGSIPSLEGGYEELAGDELAKLFGGLARLADSNKESRLSLAGSQGKTGLAHVPGASMEEGWLRPRGGAASTHVLKISAFADIPLLEYLCMKSARDLGIHVPSVELLELNRPVLCVERYDRVATMPHGRLFVERRHQEDFAQAFGLPSQSKYQELSPATASAAAKLLRAHSANPVEDIAQFVKIALFNYLVGNCDNHLKNLSVLYSKTWRSLRLAPAYDLVATTRYERFSTEMGMNINGKREIGEIAAEDWLAFANEVGIHRDELASFCADFCGNIFETLADAATAHRSIAELGWLADEMSEDMQVRWLVLDRIARG